MGIDLGTSSVVIFSKDKGIVLEEPSIVAYREDTGEVIAAGKEAEAIFGREPLGVIAEKPLRNGVIYNYDVTKEMLKIFLKRAFKGQLLRSTVVACVPCNSTEMERRAVRDAAKGTGAKKVFILEEPMAAAIGANLPIDEPFGSAIFDMGGGTSDFAVISLGGVVTSDSINIAGNRFDSEIIKYIRKKYNLHIGQKSAENLKIQIGGIYKKPLENMTMKVGGRDGLDGLPKTVEISTYDICEALEDCGEEILKCINGVLEITPPEMSGDIRDNGITLSGGASLIRGLDSLIKDRLDIDVIYAPEPMRCVAYGTGYYHDFIMKNKELLSGIEELI